MHGESPIDRLRRHLLASMGLTVLTIACSGRQTTDDAAAATGSEDDLGDGSEDATEGSETSTTATSTTDTDTDTSEPVDCTVEFLGRGDLSGYPDCELPLVGPEACNNLFYLTCVDAIDGQSCAQQCPGGSCATCQDDVALLGAFGFCGPYPLAGQCCGVVGVENDCGFQIDGRPFVVGGHTRFAAIAVKGSISNSSESAARSRELSESTRSGREILADHWARVAVAEHASIASFAQFALDLLALPGPPELIRACFSAARDEVRHAEAALALAAGLLGQPLQIGPLDVRGAGQNREDLESLVLACVREGCIGETLAALELATAAEFCEDPELAALLLGIADDETRHAGLAWRFVQWALAREPEPGSLHLAVAEAFASYRPFESESDALDSDSLGRADPRWLRAQGCLPASDRRRVAHEGLRQLLRPCAAALLASTCGEPRSLG